MGKKHQWTVSSYYKSDLDSAFHSIMVTFVLWVISIMRAFNFKLVILPTSTSNRCQPSHAFEILCWQYRLFCFCFHFCFVLISAGKNCDNRKFISTFLAWSGCSKVIPPNPTRKSFTHHGQMMDYRSKVSAWTGRCKGPPILKAYPRAHFFHLMFFLVFLWAILVENKFKICFVKLFQNATYTVTY